MRDPLRVFLDWRNRRNQEKLDKNKEMILTLLREQQNLSHDGEITNLDFCDAIWERFAEVRTLNQLYVAFEELEKDKLISRRPWPYLLPKALDRKYYSIYHEPKKAAA